MSGRSGSCRRTSFRQCGFTLIEITVAIAILGIGLSTVIILQTHYLQQFTAEKNRSKAAMYAKQIMSSIEIAPRSPDEGLTSGGLMDLFAEQGVITGNAKDEKERKAMESWTYTQEISSIDIPELQNTFKRIDLTIAWGEKADENFTLVYFVRPDPLSAVPR